MDRAVQMIRKYLSSWATRRTFDYDTLYDVMYDTVAIFQETRGQMVPAVKLWSK